MDRRRFLQALGATGVATATAGCGGLLPDEDRTTTEPPADRSPASSPTADATETPAAAGEYADRFETVVDLSAVGADTDAERSVVPLLEEHLADDTLVYLPKGRYLVDDTVRHLSFDNVGLVGDGAVIVPPEGFDDPFFDFGRAGQASNLLIDGLAFDFRAADAGSRPVSALVDDGLLIRDLTVAGTQSLGSGMLRTDVTSPEGKGLVERLRLPDGAVRDTSSNGCLVGDDHRGELRFADCLIVGFPDNGLYADPLRGRVEVVGGYYANSDISNVRVGNDSVVRGVHVRNDAAPDGYENMRGIRLTHGDGVRVEDCTIELRTVSGSGGAITLGDRLVSGTVRDTDIRVDADGINGIRAKPPLGDTPTGGTITFDSVTIRGSAATRSAMEISGRSDCVIDDCSIVQSGRDRNGVRFVSDSGGTIRNTRFDVTGTPIVTGTQSSVRVVDSFPAGLNTDDSDPPADGNRR
ncbi:twin-arginine translocation signal domain-containing protein [Halorarum halobium]|uniref:twin-arginine translocation signal domain-containing protein n=1 Tax=Halorarum halobium TaxID=3075121 RepID=UPI0028AB1646|nr:twin-arginine translocation signal domain-containing protein [Halobaculum sp. XH14]